MSFLPMWWDDPPQTTFGGIITDDGRKFRKNLMRNHTETNARLRGKGRLGDWTTYAAKWVGQGGSIVSWLVRGQSRHLDLADDRRKRLILTYNRDITDRMYRTLKSIIESVDAHVVHKDSMFYVLAQCTNVSVDGLNSVAVRTAQYRIAKSAVLHIRTKISGIANVVDRSDTVYDIFKKDGLNA